MSKIVLPPSNLYTETGDCYATKFGSYTHYNYIGKGIFYWFKRRHFEVALEFTEEYFGQCGVIDFGCNDGFFLPTLSQNFLFCIGIDRDRIYLEKANNVIKSMNLNNVVTFCNDGAAISELEKELAPFKPIKIVYLLETLEHIGERDRLYESKMDFLSDLLSVLGSDVRIVISVPNMVGFFFIIKKMIKMIIGRDRDHISVIDLFRVAVLKDTDNLEKYWTGGHLGFNHIKLERAIEKRFKILKRKNILTGMVYLIEEN